MSTLFDLAVIGGGVNGAGIARDAAGRGAKVLLLERGDLAEGTSSNSTKLIHGGLRYLEHYEFALVREALTEREVLWGIAPHIIWPLRFILPHRPGLRPRWLLRLGLFLYDHIGGRKYLPSAESVDLTRHPAGAVLKGDYTRAFAYSDGWVDDARLVVLNARDAADRGAEVRTRCEVTALSRAGDHWRIEAGGEVFTARAVVNAAGPRVLDLLGRAGEPSAQRMRLVRGSHIVVKKLFDHDFAYFFQLPDGRIFFAIPYEQDFTLIGTTDVDHHGSLDEVRASPEEIAYLCAGASEYFRTPVTPADVVWTYSGVRPLVDDGSGRPEAATRGYRFEIDGGPGEAPLLSVFGGKITTYRELSAEAISKLVPFLPVLAGADWTGGAFLPGGDFGRFDAPALARDLAERYPFLTETRAARLVRLYGTVAAEFLGAAKSAADLGEDFGHGLTAAEVDHLIAREWARSAEDVLWRRTKLGLHFTPEQTARLAAYITERTTPA
ncbi:glycerol-3-phosphate dehydrogenase [Erythrobacter sp. BLCC-B19]|uniref:glycerol-3-phosphate dehydrogenase n=1 Tax=Erythrobacter sp. BLCC-B19 TaxID=3025315 RepID=UPI00236023FC|nr:glycerol-3-phosphate dehydrogenase [Erythrobacter sp. BLCC-B19]WDA39820.1 glycerol-3-phosphate dehydrogenase [Erythrobacter sp. BLCC-B19]